MGVLERIGNIIEANLNAMLSSAEDPEKMLEQLMVDMREQYREARRQVTVAAADEKRLEAKYREAKAGADEWQRRAVLALQKSRDDLAREALLRKQEEAAAASEYLGNLEQQSLLVERLKRALVALDRKIDEAARKKDLIIARQKRAEAARTSTTGARSRRWLRSRRKWPDWRRRPRPRPKSRPSRGPRTSKRSSRSSRPATSTSS
jgi:phage shock protein A